jgi:iron complex transport system substrate-binding protein
MRICSLLPGATEILFALGLEDQVVAVSHECDFPPEVKSLPRVTTSLVDPSRLTSAEIDDLVTRAMHDGLPLYEIDQAMLERLQPDVVVTQDLCLVCAVDGGQVRSAVSECSPGSRVVALHIGSVDDLWLAITALGEACGASERAARLNADLQTRLETVRSQAPYEDRPRVLCLEWLDPPWIAGHWMPDAVAIAGGKALLASPNAPSERASWDDIAASQPDVVIVMPCGFDVERTLQEAHLLAEAPAFRSLPAVASERVFVVDGSAYFNRAGPRLVEGIEILAGLLHPTGHLAADARAAVRLDASHFIS